MHKLKAKQSKNTSKLHSTKSFCTPNASFSLLARSSISFFLFESYSFSRNLAAFLALTNLS